MVSSVYFPNIHRQNGFPPKSRLSTSLPSYSSAVQEKLEQRGIKSWFIPIYLPLPGIRTRRFRVYIPNYTRLHRSSVARFGRKRGTLLLCFALIVTMLMTFAFTKRFATKSKQWPTPFVGTAPTLVFRRRDLQRIWKWEITSGHYPSRRSVPEGLRFTEAPKNPALPSRKAASHLKPATGPLQVQTIGVGHKRVYLDIQSQPPNVAYPPRPVPGSIADLDVVMEHCDYSEKKYVRDCLEVLRLGAGLDNGKRVRRGKMDDWKYIYVEHVDNGTSPPHHLDINPSTPAMTGVSDAGLAKKRGVAWEASPITLPPPLPYRPYSSLPQPCDEDHPRIFHMFWTGPFTDKPYVSLLSFLFSQNLGLDTHDDISNRICKPRLWVWINPGPAATMPDLSATRHLFEELKVNPWSSPFLHPRFKDAIQFKLWNTTEQFDSIPELRDEWRDYDLFNSHGVIYSVPPVPENTSRGSTMSGDDLFNRTGSRSSQEYDRLSVILSDIARFLLCYRFGGTYLDADTIFLRDWEDLWGWKGAFAYRWSRLPKYNTAVLHLNKGSALGKFLIRTALRNNNDFHPMKVYNYAREAYMEDLLLRLPDALFDPAWLNVEDFQRDRPAQPFFTSFTDFFNTPTTQSAQPQVLGIDGFFRGSYSYHFHNSWWTAFDEARNWPDLGPRFTVAERTAKSMLNTTTSPSVEEERVEDDNRDLSWATVFKRTFESYIRGERPNMYGEWLKW